MGLFHLFFQIDLKCLQGGLCTGAVCDSFCKPLSLTLRSSQCTVRGEDTNISADSHTKGVGLACSPSWPACICSSRPVVSPSPPSSVPWGVDLCEQHPLFLSCSYWKGLAGLEGRREWGVGCLFPHPGTDGPFPLIFSLALAVPSSPCSSTHSASLPTPGYCAVLGWFVWLHLCRRLLDQTVLVTHWGW